MNKTYIWIAVVIVVAAIAAYFLLRGGGSGASPTSTTTAEMPTGEQQSAAAGSTFMQLVQGGQTVQCTFNYTSGSTTNSGTIYVAGNGTNVRGDFTIQEGTDTPTDAHLVRTGGYNYVWGSFYSQGIKTAVATGSRYELFGGENNAPIGPDTTYKCSPWSVDESVFSVPSTVEFIDTGAMMQQIPTVPQ